MGQEVGEIEGVLPAFFDCHLGALFAEQLLPALDLIGARGDVLQGGAALGIVYRIIRVGDGDDPAAHPAVDVVVDGVVVEYLHRRVDGCQQHVRR